MKTALEHALELYDRGYKLFPVVHNGKTPLVKGWQDWSVKAKEDDIKRQGASGCNWGIYCGPSGLTVIDLDVKEGKNGVENFNNLQIEKGLNFPDSYMVKTPSGGYHIYYDGVARTTTGAMAPGIDTRSEGGYVLAPGSTINGKAYTVLKDIATEKLPAIIPELLKRDKPKVVSDDEMIGVGERNNVLASLAGSMRARGMGFKAIYAALSEFNITQVDVPLSDEEITIIARSISSYAPENALASSDFLAPVNIKTLKASDIDPSKIQARKWYMRERYIGGHISALVSQGGIGKSTLTMLDGMALATGKPLSGFDVIRQTNVWIYNTEDPREELKRRIVALAAHHNVALKDLEGIHLSSGRDAPLILAKHGKDGVVINEKAIENIIEFIKSNSIGAFIVDPFVRTHEVNENDNMEIDKVAWILQRIADKTGCAVGVVHHTRKSSNSNGARATMDDARGASALVNAARIAHVLQTMSEGEASRFGIPKEKTGWFSRLDNAKANLQPPAEHADWFKKISVRLENGDSVGALERVELTDQSAKRNDEAELMDCLEIARVLARKYSVGEIAPVADAINLMRTTGFLSEDTSDYKFKTRLIRLLGTHKIVAGNKAFRYSVDAEGKRGKNYIICEYTIDYGKYEFLR